MRRTLNIVTALALVGCGGGGLDEWNNLSPVPNPIADEVPKQPHREHPFAVAMTSSGRTAVVTMKGSELEPGSQVAFVDVPSGSVTKRVTVGDRPVAVRLTPNDDFAVVLSQFSTYAAVIKLSSKDVTSKIEVGYYAEDLVFSDNADTMFVTNRAQDSVQKWQITRSGDELRGTMVAETAAGKNPAAVALSPDGSKVYVSDHGQLGLRVYSAESLAELAFIPFNSQVTDVKPMGRWMIATTMNDTNGLPCEDDSDFIGTQGDGILPIVTDRTCSRGFADIQNEIAFVDPATDQIVIRYTSDSAEVSENDREGDHDLELMKVVGSLPHSLAVASDTLAFVTMAASNEVVEIVINEASPPALAMQRSWDTGFNPRGIAVSEDGRSVVAANMLGETVTIIDATVEEPRNTTVGDNSPKFPATSAEIGELFFNTSKYATDGDQSCAHCHLNSETDNKAWGVEVVRAFGRRATMPLRNLATTKPLLIEGVFDENDFSLEMEGISFRPDFHDSSFTLQVQRRNEFYAVTSRELFGQEVEFEEMVHHVASFLMVEPRLLPSPFDKDTPEVERGKAIFERPDVACAACHPEPTFASEELFEGITTLGRYDLPRRDIDPDVSVKFIETAQDGFFNANSLRGLWDRKGSFFHDGRARTVRETILTPGHPCLQPGEIAFNEFEGRVDTNGGISHLTCEQIDDLVSFMMTID